jgi:hypothetical protein
VRAIIIVNVRAENICDLIKVGGANQSCFYHLRAIKDTLLNSACFIRNQKSKISKANKKKWHQCRALLRRFSGYATGITPKSRRLHTPLPAAEGQKSAPAGHSGAATSPINAGAVKGPTKPRPTARGPIAEAVRAAHALPLPLVGYATCDECRHRRLHTQFKRSTQGDLNMWH